MRPSSQANLGSRAWWRASGGLLAGAALMGLAMVATGLLVGTSSWVEFFAHEARTARHGGVVAATTIDGARWWRVALTVGGVALPAMVALLAWLARGQGLACGEASPARSVRSGLALPLLVIAALALRATRLSESLWYDEIADFLAFGQFGPGPTMGNYFTQSNHILNGILCWAAVQLAGGANEIVLRVPALLASLCSVAAFAWLGREVRREAQGQARDTSGSAASALPWLMAGFAALAPVMVLEGAEARGYALMILASAMSSAAFLRATRQVRGGSPQAAITWTAYAVIVALGSWAHLVTACVAAGHGLVLLVDLAAPARRRGAVAGLLAIAMAALLVIVLYSPALPDMLAIRDQFRALDGNEPTLLGPEGAHALYQMGGAWSPIWTLPGAALVLIGLAVGMREPALRRAFAVCLAGGLVAVALAWAGNSWLYARFVLFTLPGAALLLGWGAAHLLARRRCRGPAIALLLLTVAGWMGDLATRPPKQPLREAVFAVAGGRTAGERVATIGLLDNVLEWYAMPRGMPILTTGVLGSRLSEVLDREGPEWVVLLYARSVPPERLAALERRGYVLHEVHRGWVDWGNGDVGIWRRSPAASR